jgi:hypothetical protein
MHERAKIAARGNDLSKAFELNERAYQLVITGKPTNSSVMATRYQQGWVSMQRGENEEALHHFRTALTICQLNHVQRGNRGDSAWVEWRMSGIMEAQGLTEKAKIFRDAALETRDKHQQTGEYPAGISEDDGWDVFLGLLYR